MGVHIHKLSHEPPKASEIATTRESVSLCENTGTVNNARKVKTKANAVPAIVLFWYHLGDRMSLPKIAAAGSATNIGARRLKGSRVSAKNPTTILKKRIPGSPRLANLVGGSTQHQTHEAAPVTKRETPPPTATKCAQCRRE
eukprot:GHVT01076319.1.p1 GENE.GHVT01076319.1~~GHVT01076319.1.p1  ORF type:complete len:142 (-),score=16.37 GHVT01076319.1:1473-1898(-)